MIKTINKYDFSNAFKSSDTYRDKFTIEALDALFAHFEECEEETGTPIELDVVAIACEYTEYESLAEVQEAYEGVDIRTLDGLGYRTTVIPVPDTDRLIVANF